MDGSRFDSLVKSLATGRTRRSAIKTLLGFGATAIAVDASERSSEAARRPTPTPRAPTCPGIQVPCASGCCCPPDHLKCGPACCQDTLTTCCDNACCSGVCYQEELCCPPDQWCGPTGECCPEGTVCCGSKGCVLPGEAGCCCLGDQLCRDGLCFDNCQVAPCGDWCPLWNEFTDAQGCYCAGVVRELFCDPEPCPPGFACITGLCLRPCQEDQP
jgi:hypothetical protein